MTTIINCEQRSDEWFKARLGRLTSSRASDAFATLKSGKGEAASRRNLRVSLALERLTGQPCEDRYSNKHMDRGVELEPEAVAVYEATKGVFVERVGFISHDELMAGYSPDGLVEPDGLIECKAPIPAVHLGYFRDGIPSDYLTQIRHALWMTGRAWADFVSYCTAFPEDMQLYVKRVYALDLDIPGYERDVRAFLADVDKELDAINKLRGTHAA